MGFTKMNNDIWSVRDKPLNTGKTIELAVLRRPFPPKKSMFFFINNRLKRAWQLLVLHYEKANEYTAYVIKEVRYEDAIQNH